MKTISICIPTYEMKGWGHIFLKESFDVFLTQTFKDFEVVISDHSKNNLIEDLCKSYQDRLSIKYVRNAEQIGNYSFNLNNSIKNAGGKLIKILLQDDYLYGEGALEDIYKNFDLEKDFWLITPCVHTKNRIDVFRPFYPKWNDRIHLGKNTLGSPTVLTFKNESPLLFDEKLIWFNDCDYYKRCFERFGFPKITKRLGVVIGVGDHQITNTLATEKLRKREHEYMVAKYHESNLENWKYSLRQFLKRLFYKFKC